MGIIEYTYVYIRLRQAGMHICMYVLYIRPQGMLWMKLRVKPLTKFWPEHIVCVYDLPLYEFIFDQPTKLLTTTMSKLWLLNYGDEKDKVAQVESSDHNIFPKPIGHEKLPVRRILYTHPRMGESHLIFFSWCVCFALSELTHVCASIMECQ